MYFRHADELWEEFPELAAGVVLAAGITPDGAVDAPIAAFEATARARLATSSEGELPEIQAWRRAFTRMGLKPTQYRCASEALLRRFKKEGALPRIHPLVDLCNAISMAFAIPVAIFDVARIASHLEVRHAGGDEVYASFGGETEHPQPREVIFSDAAGAAHARRWTNRQSALSAVRAETAQVLIVAEAMHAAARADVERLTATLADALASLWPVSARSALLSRATPRFEF